MNLINEVDRPGSDIEQYVMSLDKYLAEKENKIAALRARLRKFNVMLKDEEALSSKFMNNNDILDMYELNKRNDFNNDEDILNVDLNSHFRK